MLRKFKMPQLRGRHSLMVMALIVLPCILILASPEVGIIKNLPFGAGIFEYGLNLGLGFIGVLGLHLLRKTVFDYASADIQLLGDKAMETSVGAALFAIAIGIMVLAFAIVIAFLPR